MKKPASDTHLTVLELGKRARKLSQFRIVANPPADPPASRACKYY